MEKVVSAELTVQSSIKECESHTGRIRKILKNMDEDQPLTEQKLKDDANDIVGKIDQLIYRFTKLQDSMGTRLYPSLYTILEENNKIIPFLDILNRLEKLDIIPSVSDWQFFRNLRNNLAHDYPESVGKTIETLNLLITEVEKLMSMFNQAKNYYIKRQQV